MFRLLQSTDDEEKLAASIFDIVQEKVLVNSHKLGNYSEVGVIEFLRNY